MNVVGPHGHVPVRVTRASLDRATFFALVGSAVQVAMPGSAPVVMLIELGGLSSIALANGPAMALAEAAAGRIAGVLGEGGYVSIQRSGRIAVLAEDDGSGAIDSLGTALLACLVRPLVVEGVTLLAGATLGVARWNSDGATAEELFVAADHAIRVALGELVQAPPPPVIRRGVNYRPSPLRAA